MPTVEQLSLAVGMRRREFLGVIWGLAGAISLPACVASAQELGPPRLGVILQGGPWYAVVDGLRQGLKQLGLVEGTQFVLDIRDTGGDLKKVADVARILEREGVRLIYTVATSVSLAARQATQEVPIVFFAGTNPVTVNLVESISRPGNRLTGVYARATDVTGKRLELLREIVPNIRRVVTYYDPSNPAALEAAKEGREAARNLGLEFIERHVTSVEQFRGALLAFRAGEADAYFAISDAMIDTQTSAIVELAVSRKLPTMFYQPSVVEEGGLASYSWDLVEIGRVSAKHVQRVLRGTSPADLPIEGIDRLLLTINLRAAKQIGLEIPEAVLTRADKVFE
jgi:putative tryptophan/tyrosine transport system substrate-binding protein